MTSEQRKVRVVPKKQPQPHDPPQHGIRFFKLGQGFNLADLQVEIDGYIAIALGREDPPYDNGPMTMMEFSNAVYARLTELEVELHRGEVDGHIIKGSRLYRFRTGELRSAQELFVKMQELGSRRVTVALAENNGTYYMEGKRDY